jgi:RND family efflux transporter MFP subunit
MYKTILVNVMIAVAGLTAGCGGSSPHEKTSAAGSPMKVSVARVERSAGQSHEEIMGTVVARNRADIQSKAQARVERIPVTLGSVVQQGDLLAELDSRELQARVGQSRAVNNQTAMELGRYDSLLSRKLVSQQEYDAVKARADVARASLAEAEAMLSYTRILAPFSGRVTQKSIDIGDLAVPGKPLFVLEEDAALRFEVHIPESQRRFIALGDNLPIAIESADSQTTGRVIEISPSADVASRTFLTKLEIPRANGIRSGQFGRLLLPTGNDSSLFVPAQALVKRGQLEILFVVSPEFRAQARLVRSGRLVSDRIEILSGLTEGEQVAITGASLLSEGDSVEIVR